MFGHDYYHGVIRKYIIMFGNMFNDIDVTRFDNAGNAEQIIRVPIAYGPKEKYLSRIRQIPQDDRDIAIQLPRLAFEMLNVSPVTNRGVNKLNRNVSCASPDATNSFATQFAPVPVDIEMALYGMFTFNEDAVQVTEQILPFFRPEFTHSVKLVDAMEQYYDVPTTFTGMSIEDTYEADFQSRRAIIYTYNFNIKGYIFGPTTNKGIIKRANIHLVIPTANTTQGDVVTDPTEGPNVAIRVQPGLFANGSPTTNSASSVSITEIDGDDNYGIAIDKFEYFDGEDRHNH